MDTFIYVSAKSVRVRSFPYREICFQTRGIDSLSLRSNHAVQCFVVAFSFHKKNFFQILPVKYSFF